MGFCEVPLRGYLKKTCGPMHFSLNAFQYLGYNRGRAGDAANFASD
jgi:hypothetical protein